MAVVDNRGLAEGEGAVRALGRDLDVGVHLGFQGKERGEVPV